MNFDKFRKTFNLQNKATSNVKISEVINKLKINDFDIYMRDAKLTTKQGIINLDTKKGTHWVCYYGNYYFDSFGVRPPKHVEKQLKPLVFSTYKIQNINENLCASYCLYILYLINLGFTFEQAVLKLFYFLNR